MVCDDFAELGEMPAVPFTTSHVVVVKLLVDIVEQRDCLYYHSVYLVWRELQLVSRKAVCQT